MIAIPIVLGALFVWWRLRQNNVRSSNLAANQAAQQVQSPYAALYPRSGRLGMRGALAERFLNRGGKF